jgi:dihydrofolate synthase/folylpolyglutamate synthase
VRDSLVCLSTEHSQLEHFAVPVRGEHQAQNAGLALALLDALVGQGHEVDFDAAQQALRDLRMPARMEIVAQTSPGPQIVIDGAHNEASVCALLQNASQIARYDSLVLIFGCCQDKDVEGMLSAMACGADKVIFTAVNNARTADPAELAARYHDRFSRVAQHAPTLDAALAAAKRAATKDDLIVITGSFYLAAEARRRFRALATAG